MAINIDKFVSGVIGIIVAVKSRKSELESGSGFDSRSRYSDHRYPDHINKPGRVNCGELRKHECDAQHHSSAYHRWSHHGSCRNVPLLQEELMRLKCVAF